MFGLEKTFPAKPQEKFNKKNEIPVRAKSLTHFHCLDNFKMNRFRAVEGFKEKFC